MPRNSSGTYSLPAGNPVVTGTLIETNWANPTMSDIGSAITDSLDRFGRGGMLAQLKLADGTLAAPAFAFNSEASTGLYRPAAATLNVSVLGTLVASFTNAAITLSKPTTITAVLTLSAALAFFAGTAALPGLAVAADPNTGIYGDAADTIGISTAGTSRLTINPTGLVAIGVAPIATVALTVHTAANRNVGIFDQASTATVSSFTDAGVAAPLRVQGNPLVFGGNGAAEFARIDASGNFGLGNTPGARFDVSTGTTNRFRIAESTGILIFDSLNAAASAWLPKTERATGFNWFTAAAGTPSTGMVLDSSGRLGVGVAPSFKFDTRTSVAGDTVAFIANLGASTTFTACSFTNNSDANIDIVISGVGAATKFAAMGPTVAVPFIFNTNSTERMRIDAVGRVGIGRSAGSGFLLETQGSIKAYGAAASDIGVAAEASGILEARFGVNNSGSTNPYGAPTSSIYFGTAQGSAMSLTTSGTERVRIDAAGNVGIGGSPSGKLSVIMTTNSAASVTAWGNSSAVFGPNALSATGSALGLGYDLTLNQGNILSLAPGTAWRPLGLYSAGLVVYANNGNENFGFTADGRLYGKALHNNGGALTGTTNQYVASTSGNALTLTSVLNCNTLTQVGKTTVIRTGNVVFVALALTANFVGAATVQVQFGISLPIPSNLTAANELTGNATYISPTPATGAGFVSTDAANDRAQVQITSTGNGTYTIYVMFQYEIL